MPVRTNHSLKKEQREFKLGKTCAVCGEKYIPELMTVDHIIPRCFYGNPYDRNNWQVLCLNCHRHKSRLETLILSGQYDKILPSEYASIAGIEEFKNKINEARQKLGYDDKTPLDGNSFKLSGIKFKKRR